MDPEPMPPVLPKGVPAPWIYPSSSIIATDWGRMLDARESGADVRLDIGTDSIWAHQVLLASSCTMFARLLHFGLPENEWFDWDAVNAGVVPPFARIARHGDDGVVSIGFTDGVTRKMLQRILTFLYTGQCAIADAKDAVAETMEAAELFGLDLFRNYCQNVLDGAAEVLLGD